MKKIFMQEWMAGRPYRQADVADQYYLGIANQLAVITKKHITDSVVGDHQHRLIGGYLSAWFEDVICGIGIWKAFTSECQHRYGYYVPFYPTGSDYYTDEVNVQDIRFLLWHYLQTVCRDEKVINPEDAHIEKAADEIYALLSAQYETAPENESLQNAFFGHAFGKDDFYRYREFLEWYHFNSYLNCENRSEFQQLFSDALAEREQENRQLDEHEMFLLRFGILSEVEFHGRLNALSLTSPEWLARIGVGHAETEAWTTLRVNDHPYFLYVKKDDEYVYVKDLVAGSDELLPVKRISFDPAQVEQWADGQQVFHTTLVQYMGEWYQCGVLLVAHVSDAVMAEVENFQSAAFHTHEKADYEKFMQASGGKRFIFCKTLQEVEDFFTQKIGVSLNEKGDHPVVDEKTGAVLMASPISGIHLQMVLSECIKSPDNTLYDEASARKNAMSLMVSPNVIPYDLSCALLDAGMLDDALMNSRKGEQYGADLLHRNARFLTDYYFSACREKDYQV